jgi:tetratricopeptide (TPR) repeat protein
MRIALRACAALACVGLAQPVGAQKVDDVPRRPHLNADADSNDFRSYYDLGVLLAPTNPSDAAGAFYWALRLNPASAEALYGRYAALLMSDKWRLFQVTWRGNIGVIREPETRKIDSLFFRALEMNPFLYKNLDRDVMRTALLYFAEDQRGKGSSASELEYYIEQWLRGAGPEVRAWMSYGTGDFDDAISNYGLAIKGATGRQAASLLVDRARLYVTLGQIPLALADFNTALSRMRHMDSTQFMFVYDSKALLEYSVGMLYERDHAVDSAKAAYSRAIQEDLSFYPAHVHLAQLALQQHDTTTALSELELATQLGTDAAPLHFMYAYALATLQRNEDAEREARKAIALEPYFARPYALLGDLLASEDKQADARAQYQEFLKRAARNDPQRSDVEQSVASIPPS